MDLEVWASTVFKKRLRMPFIVQYFSWLLRIVGTRRAQKPDHHVQHVASGGRSQDYARNACRMASGDEYESLKKS
ncbi:hypothetical protein HBI56_135190 [Parastagonospora nodorum]|uniref:Uncharacterized protein n=1 Tax=Phaeosphaeria nodorum (strain SN15 / ATCC MYA-4574 / FGSC 10173) TaxID=321614 RepID=A0A7U2FBF7_PHANO|nr:hypothetical protein HBH56_038290 [Parastagonospora nodorum]QRC99874.1 hypothetical protein JI435_414180 [Parastagonospora nodorum SN15]KAH3933867.1 hypothetical protein HBH54_061170 [Parastagonospora nodorum]KAH3952367.1 hypothetical protein HBH53_048940 [Parastagonospora nodorum]KAH3979495.1 hypothetical protein HBH51_059950 [Parastagonospora nodorum]